MACHKDMWDNNNSDNNNAYNEHRRVDEATKRGCHKGAVCGGQGNERSCQLAKLQLRYDNNAIKQSIN